MSKIKSGPTNEAKLNELINAAVEKAIAKVAEKNAAAAVHTDDVKNTKGYVDGQIAEAIGAERAEVRRDSEKRGAMNMAQGRFGDQLNVRLARTDAGRAFTQYVAGLSLAPTDPERAAKLGLKRGLDSMVMKALGVSTVASGGAFVPENIASDYIELLRAASVFLAAGPRMINVANGNLSLPKLTGGSTGYWVGESQNITKSEPTTGAVRLDLKKLGIIVPASVEFVRDSGPSALDMMRLDIAESAASAIDSALLRGAGSAYSPRGIASIVHADHQLQASGTDVPSITSDLAEMFQKLAEANIRNASLALFMSPRTKFGIMAKRDSNNNLVWAGEMAGGTLMGAPFADTTNIPDNVGSGSTKSELYLCAMNDLVVGEDSAGVQIAMSSEAAYDDGSSVVSAFSRDEIVMKLTQRIDLVERRGGKAIVQTYDVAYAA